MGATFIFFVLAAAKLGEDFGRGELLPVTGKGVGVRFPVDEVLDVDVEAARIVERPEPEVKGPLMRSWCSDAIESAIRRLFG